MDSLGSKLKRLVRGRSSRHATRRNRIRRWLFESLEARELMALNILSVSPLDGATNVPVNTDLVFTFNEEVLKGQGNIYVVPNQPSQPTISVDVQSANVVVQGAKVTVDLPIDLSLDGNYSVIIDAGSFLDTSTTPTTAGALLTQNFDYLTLGPQVFETVGNGFDWTPTPPLGFVSDTSKMQGTGAAEWRGWTFARKEFWIAADNQSRDAFTLASGNVAVADTDEYDDGPGSVRPFDGILLTKPVDLTGVAANSVKFEFDSSFRPEDSQIGTLEVSYDGGANWTNLLTLNPANTDNDAPFGKKNVNERLVTGGTTGGGTSIGVVNNPSSGSMVFRFEVIGGNDWWWAIDNLKITGDYVGVPFDGVSDKTVWDFRTPESPKLTLTIDKSSMSENGGTATGTVSRNNLPTGDVIVTLASSDPSEATVPATVTILDGQSSVTFPITAVDDALSDRTQSVTITATSAVYAASSKVIDVTDDEGPKIVSLTPPDNATGVDYKSNFEITFDTDIRKGSGRIYLVKSSTNAYITQIDVNSSEVTVSGKTVSFDPPVNLEGLTDYYVIIDDGAFLDTSTTLTANAVLHTQSFDLVPLVPFTTEPNGDGTDVSKTLPLGYVVDNSLMPGGSVSDFHGWVAMDKNSWINTEGDQSRSRFTRGQGSVLVADSDAWDDSPHDPGRMNTRLVTPGIDLTGITPGSVVLEFDSSFFPELPQFGQVLVSYDDGGSWSNLLFFGDAGNPNDGRNDRIVIDKNASFGSFIGGATVDAALNTPAAGVLKFRFDYLEGENNWWWAIDNLVIRGEREGVPFAGISEPSIWNVTTAEAPTLTVTIDPASMSENGGVAVGTVTRNLSSVGDLVVSLSSSDTTEATVPATVTIPDGAFSVTFPITAVDDVLPDGTQVATISATVVDYFNVPASINVLDDDFPKIVSITPVDNATGVDVSTNIVVKFDQPIRKGNGFIQLVRGSDNKSMVSVDVNSSAVVIVGDTMTIDPSLNLEGLTDYYLRIDSGTVLNLLSNVATGVVLLDQNFEFLPLRAAPYELNGLTANGRDYTPVPPSGWQVNNTNMPGGGAPEWTGWTFAEKSFWVGQGGQNRANFARGSGTIAIGDTDEWQDYARQSDNFNSFFTTSPIDLDAVQPNTVLLEFDSSFRPESTTLTGTPLANDQQGKIDVSYDGGTTWTNLLTLDSTNTLGAATAPNVNERRSLVIPNPDTGSMVLRWGLTGTNDWWWAIDNIVVKGDTVGLPFPGLTDPTIANFTTAVAPSLAVTLAPTVAENAGTLTGSVARTAGTTGDLVVTLLSSNTSMGTVPATVTIPDGQSSVSFDVTLLDNTVYNASTALTITASAATLVEGTANVVVTDNETGSVVFTEIMYDPSGEEQRTEWIEVVNRGTTVADLSGWVLDDEDKQNWKPIPSGFTLDPGQVGVIYNSFFGLNTDTLFRTQWSVPAAAKVVGVFWSSEDDGSNKSRGGLFNNPGAGNEVLVLRDGSGSAVNTVPLAEDGTVWPAYSNGSSVYLLDINADNSVGTNWKSSRVATDGGINSIGPNFSTTDIGSPGWVLLNAAPSLVVNNATVTGPEGVPIVNGGTWSDSNAGDVVTLTANVGSIVQNSDGTWSWSISAPDDQASTSVTITADDGKRGITRVNFTYSATNAAPSLTASQANVSGVVFSTLTNVGTWSDVAADTVTLSASKGSVTKNGDGTWIWSLATDAAINAEVITITGTDEDGGSSSVTFTIDALVAVTNSKVYYKGSTFAGTSVDAALDTSKSLARSGPTSRLLGYENLINTSRGINGLVFDVAGLVGTTLSASDFTFRVSPTGAYNEAANPPSGWATAPVPTLINVIAGGTTGPSRVRLEWADNAISNQWLQIRVLANANTGLRSPEVYYVGHLLGETTGTVSGGSFVVQNADITPISQAVGTSVAVSSRLDLTKNGLIQNSDIIAMRSRVGLGALRLITIPASGSGAEGESGGTAGLMVPIVSQVASVESSIGVRWTGMNYDVQPATLDLADSGSLLVGPVAWFPNPIATTQASGLGPTSSPDAESAVDFSSLDEFFSELGKSKKFMLSRR